MEHEPDEHFRIFFWQKVIPLLGLPVLAAPLAISPLTNGWTGTSWSVAGALLAAAILAYFVRVWQKSDVLLDADGMQVYVGSELDSWPYEKLLKVKQVGKYRVRMCYHLDREDGQHMHVTLDLWDSDGFVDALLDRYALTQGEELGEDRVHAA